MGPERCQMADHRATVAAGHRTGQGGRDPEAPGVAQCLLDQPAVDRQAARLVEAGDPAQLRDRVEQRVEATCGEHGGGVVGGFGTGREADGRATDHLGHPGEQVEELVIALDRDRRAVEGRHRTLEIGECDERMERSDLSSRRHRGREGLGPEQSAGMDHRLAAVHVDRARDRGDRIVRHGDDDQLDLLDERRGVAERANPGDEPAEPVPSRLAPAGDGVDPPAGPVESHAEGRPDRAGPDDPDDRRLARAALNVRVSVGMGGMVVIRAVVRAVVRAVIAIDVLGGAEPGRSGRLRR